MLNIFKHAHSGIRWIVLILLIAAVVNAFLKWRSGKAFTDTDKKLFLFSMIFMHVQFLIGLVLYFTSPKVIFAAESMKNAMNRFFLVEHSFMMLLALILITVGYGRVKRITDDTNKFKRGFTFYFIALILLLIGIPWPFRGFGTGWF